MNKIKQYIAPISVIFLALILEYVFPLFNLPAFYVLLYLAFFFNTWLNGNGRWITVLTSILICIFAWYDSSDPPARLIGFSIITLGIGYLDEPIKRRLKAQATEAERLRQENTRQTEQIRQQSLALAEIKNLGSDVGRIVKRVEEASRLLNLVLENPNRASNQDDIRLALHKLNESLTLTIGYHTLALDIENIKRKTE